MGESLTGLLITLIPVLMPAVPPPTDHMDPEPLARPIILIPAQWRAALQFQRLTVQEVRDRPTIRIQVHPRATRQGSGAYGQAGTSVYNNGHGTATQTAMPRIIMAKLLPAHEIQMEEKQLLAAVRMVAAG